MPHASSSASDGAGHVDSAPQGEGDACLNAPEAYRLNWATAIASLDATSLVPGTSATYDLPAIHTSQTNMVIVKANVSSS